MSTGEELRDEGVARVNRTVAEAEEFAAWRTGAKAHFLKVLERGPCTLEQALDSYPAPPPNFPPNGIGALAIGLAKAYLIEGEGYTTASKSSRHAGAVRVWKLVQCASPMLKGVKRHGSK